MSEEEYISQISAEYTYMLDKQEEQLNKYKQALLDIKEYTEKYKREGMGEEWFETSTPVSYILKIINKALGSDSNE